MWAKYRLTCAPFWGCARLEPGTLLRAGRYTVQRVLGSGGFGVTYLCLDGALQVGVAVKEYFPLGSERVAGEVTPGRLDPEGFYSGLRRFEREARTLFGLSHPNIVRALEFFQERGTAYLVSRFVDGQVLGQQHQNWLEPIVSALRAVHGQGLVHGDVKPENILIQVDGRPILIDFGSSRPSHTLPSARIVSSGYSPPEQYTSQPLTPAADQYSLAATYLGWLRGRPPADALQRLSHPALGDLAPALQRALALKPEDRWPDLAAFIQALVGGQVTTLAGHRGWVRCLASQADWLASGGEDRQVRIWNLSDGSERVLGQHQGWVNALVVQDCRLFSLGTDRSLHCYDLASGQLLGQFRLESQPLCATAAGEHLLIGDDQGHVCRWETVTNTLVERWKAAPEAITCLLSWGQMLACNGHYERIGLWDLARHRLLEKLKGHSGPVKCLCQDRDVLYSGGSDRRILSWDWREGRSCQIGQLKGTAWALLATSTGLVSADGAKQIRLWQAERSRLLGEQAGEVRCLANAAGRVAAAGQSGQVGLYG